jgi:hypothetical protein
MERVWKELGKFGLGFSTNAFYRSLAYGILFSIIMTLLIGSIEDVFQFDQAFPYIVVKTQAYWVGIIFVSFSFLFAFFGYLSDINAREDILSPLRKKLVGYWAVRSQTWKIENGKIEFGYTTDFCTIGIEEVGGKLVMHFDVSNSDIFQNQSIDITNITLAYQGEPRKLIYFHEADLKLKEVIGEGSEQLTRINFPFLGILNILVENDVVNVMEGRWYDIDNSIYGLARRMSGLAGFQELTQAVENGAVTFKGLLEFKRLKKPPGIAGALS